MGHRLFPAGRITALLLWASALAATGRAATLVEAGKPRAVIILPEKASPAALSASRILRDHVRQMSGAVLPVRTEDKIKGEASRDEAWVLVGEGKLTKRL